MEATMGEKGNAVMGAGAGAIAAGTTLIERATTTATETVTGVGLDFLDTVKDKSIGAVADNTLAVARDKMHRRPDLDANGSTTAPIADDSSDADPA